MSKNVQEKKSPLHKITSAVGIVLCIIFGFTLICNLVVIVKGSIFPDRPPSVLGITPMAVLSGSMSGTEEGHIEVGDLIFVEKADPEELKEGDVIAYMSGSSVITHRITEVQTAEDGAIQWITKGDANNAADQKPVHQDRLVGIYAARIPKLGDFALFMQKPLGMLLFVGVPVMAFIIYDIIRRQRCTIRENQKNAEMEAELERLRAQVRAADAAQDEPENR